jgi:Flp pilus assembly protein TadD
MSTATPISDAQRRRLQQCFDAGTKNMQSGNYDYAIDMLMQCVTSDPGNQIYAQAFLGTLCRKYNNNRKGSTLASIKAAGSKTSMMNATRKKDWMGVIKAGFEVLKINPWDVSALLHIAKACAELKHVECQLVYLKAAQNADPKSAEVHRECAIALTTIGQFDQAISCWVRVDNLTKGGSEEASRQITELQVEKSMNLGGLKKEGGEATGDAGESEKAPSIVQSTKRTRAQELDEHIKASPGEVNPYSEMAEIHVKDNKWAEAEAILKSGLQATGGDLRLREQLEDLQLRRARQNVLVAERRAAEQGTDETKKQAHQMSAELNRQEIEIYRSRVDRYPTNTGWKYELGIRLKKGGNFNEAIKLLQEARSDPKHKGTVLLDLGECFQQIKQFRLAKQHYVQAIEEMPDKEIDYRKKALYRAGVLSMGLAEQEKGQLNEAELNDAEKYLTDLAGLDFGYKDVSERLDKIAKKRDKG